jgi:hypothetical protein
MLLQILFNCNFKESMLKVELFLQRDISTIYSEILCQFPGTQLDRDELLFGLYRTVLPTMHFLLPCGFLFCQ